MINHFIDAFILGLIGGIIPGPVLTTTFTEILQSGFIRGMRIVLLALISETFVASICLLILSSFNLPESIFRALSLVGALILIWIAKSIWKIKRLDTGKQVHFSFAQITGMILANGVLWTFWITVYVPKAIALSHEIQFGGILLLIIVEIGWLFSTSLVALIFAQFRGLLSNPKVIPILFKIFALTFIYFAISSIYQSILFFIHQ